MSIFSDRLKEGAHKVGVDAVRFRARTWKLGGGTDVDGMMQRCFREGDSFGLGGDTKSRAMFEGIVAGWLARNEKGDGVKK